MKMQRLIAIARKEFLHVIRDWRSLFLAIAIPALLILLFGWALDMDLNKVPTVVWDQSGTPASRELLSLLGGSPYFDIRGGEDSYDAIEQDIERGRAILALIVPSDFADAVQGGRPTAVQVIVDGSDANTARLALGYVGIIGRMYNEQLRAVRLDRMGLGKLDAPISLDARAWYNPTLRSRNGLIPGIVAIVMVVIAAMLTSVTVAREWETGTMEQLISTPVRVPEILIGKVIPYFVIGMTDVTIAVVMGRLVFGVPIRGNAGLVFAVSAVFLTGALFFGLMLSVTLKTQVLANQAALLGSYLPTMLLSGFVFAIENMPPPIQAITYLFPGRYFIYMTRAIFLKGIGLEVLWGNALLLVAYAVLMILLAHKNLKLKLG